MGRITANGVELEYGTFGSPDDPTVLLVAGLGMQMTGWHEEFCGELAARGFHVVRYDNRDCGLSGGPADPPHPDFAAIRTGDYSSAAYTIPDLALDAVGLLDGLGVEAAHVVGVSMGGMIVQQLAIDHPERMLSLCSVMSTPGRTRGRSTPQAQAVLFRPPGTTREEVIEQGLETWTVIGSPDYPADPEELRARVTAEYDRAFRPDGTALSEFGFPPLADGTYSIAMEIDDANGKALLSKNDTFVQKAFPFQSFKGGIEETVVKPYTPIVATADSYETVGNKVNLTPNGLPASIHSKLISDDALPDIDCVPRFATFPEMITVSICLALSGDSSSAKLMQVPRMSTNTLPAHTSPLAPNTPITPICGRIPMKVLPVITVLRAFLLTR